MATRLARVIVPAAFVAITGTAVAAATWPGEQPQIAYPAPAASASTSVAAGLTSERSPDISRDLPRPSMSPTPKATEKAKAKDKDKKKAKAAEAKVTPDPVPTPALKVVGRKYATAGLNIRTDPAMDSDVTTVVPTGTKLSITATVYKGFRFVSYQGKGRWVRNQYLSDKKPAADKKSGGVSSAACSSGTKVESGLTRDAIRVHRALCARYPQISSFGGSRSGGGYHGSGQALDCMISNSSVGWDVANWVRANAKRLGVSEVIYSQKIWTVQRGSEGWRGMSDRGSATANHYDHVHVSVYGNRGTG